MTILRKVVLSLATGLTYSDGCYENYKTNIYFPVGAATKKLKANLLLLVTIVQDHMLHSLFTDSAVAFILSSYHCCFFVHLCSFVSSFDLYYLYLLKTLQILSWNEVKYK